MITVVILISGLTAAPGFASETAKKTVELINGKNMDGWHARRGTEHKWLAAKDVKVDKKDNKRFSIVEGEGIIVNGKDGKTDDILTDYKHGDCILHVEFNVPFGSNSGVYFQGLYEIQVFDSYKKEKVDYGDCGGIYARYDSKAKKTFEGHPPRVNVSKAPGEWQSFDAVFRAPRFDRDGKKTENAKFVKVKHNGTLVHENVEVTGGTRACLNKKEEPTGPLMLQGDHGPVAYRNMVLVPVQLP